MTCVARGRRGTLETTSDVSYCVFFRNRIGRAVSSDKCLQPANSMAGVVKLGKFVGKRRCWSLQTEKIWGSLVQMLVLSFQPVSSWFCGFLVASLCLCGKLQNLQYHFGRFQKRFLMCSNVVLRGRRGTSWHSDASHKVSKVVLCGGGQAEHFRRVHLLSRGRCSALDVWCLWCCLFLRKVVRTCKLRGRCGISWGYRSVVCGMSFCVPGAIFGCIWDTLPFRLYTPNSTLYTLHSTLYTLHFTPYTLQFALRTFSLHLTLCTLRFALYTLHSALYTLHCTPHSTLYTLHFTLCAAHSTLYTLHFTLYAAHSTLYTPHFALYTSHLTPCTLHFTLCTLLFTPVHSAITLTLRTLHFTLRTLHFTLHTLRFAFHTFTFHTSHWALHTLHFALCASHFTLGTPHSTHFLL